VAKSRTFGGHEKNRAFWTEEDDGAIVEGGREIEMEELGAKGCSSEEERTGERGGDTRRKGFSRK
jgi:hypothetical protein